MNDVPLWAVAALSIVMQAAVSTASAADFTVTGIEPGQTLAEAKGKLPPDLPPSDLTLGVKQDQVVTTAYSKYEAYVLCSLDGVVYYVQHLQIFNKDTMPNVQTLLLQLKDKYGPPSAGGSDNRMLMSLGDTWFFDAKDNLIPAATAGRDPYGARCDQDGGKGIQLGELMVGYPVSFKADCGRRVTAAMVKFGPNQALVGSLNVESLDQRPMFHKLQAEKDAQAKAASDAAEAAKANKTKL